MDIVIAGRKYRVASLKAASRLYSAQRDNAFARGARTFRPAEVSSNGVVVATISQNGNVWPPSEWFVGQQPLLRVAGL